jgi:hypothetical protein
MLRPASDVQSNESKQVFVCICMNERPRLLKRLLDELQDPDIGGRSIYSIADSDRSHSGSLWCRSSSTVPCIFIRRYCVNFVERRADLTITNLERRTCDLLGKNNS